MGPIRAGNPRGCRPAAWALLLLAAAAAAQLPAQAGATTLQACADAATRVVVGRAVDRTDDPVQARTTVRFTVERVLRGAAAPTYVDLEEASGEACGRALFAVLPGMRRILFLDGDSPTPHPVRLGARGLPAADDASIAHVEELLRTATNPTARRHLLLAALDHATPRVRDDAAHALAATPALGPAGGTDSLRLLAALDRAFDDPALDPTPLWIAATRCDPQASFDHLCDGYLRTRRTEILDLLEGALLATSTDRLADRLVPALLHDATPTAARRAAALLERLEPSPARARIARALVAAAAAERAVAVQATAALLGDAAPAAWLQAMVAPDVLRDAARLHDAPAAAADPPTRWRSIDPERLR